MARRPRYLLWTLLLLPIAGLLLVSWDAIAPSVTTSTDRGSYFFRLKASYSHKGEPIDFDFVVACSIRVDRYRSGDSGFLATRYPRFFVKRTKNDHAVMQIVPIACRGETTQEGSVPEDFLPGAIWFDKFGDYRFGIGYVSEDAFESPNSQLTFHGASIERATREEWEKFEKRAADNEGMRARYYDRPVYWTGDAKRIAKSGGNEIEAAYARACTGVLRYKLTDAARAILRDYWPSNKPRFWATNNRKDGPWSSLLDLDKRRKTFANGLRFTEQLNHNNYKYGGFPTRGGGGMISKSQRNIAPTDLYPLRSDRGIPWVFADDVAASNFLTRDIDVSKGSGRGFLYCYTTLNPGKGKLEVPIPDFRRRESRLRVDGSWVETPDPSHWSWPSPFFEKDEYMYLQFSVSLT